MSITIDKSTILKYDIPGPRYTSYPTAPNWTSQIKEETYINCLKKLGASNKTLSLYIHIPFCQSMCTYCGCNVVIRKNDTKYGDEYLSYLFKEIDLVSKYLGKKMVVRQFHWGGGTPTFLDEEQMQRLFNKVKENFNIDPDGEIAIEIDPRTIDKSKVKKLKQLGFNRISMGVQDFNYEVQEAVNRIQSYETVEDFYYWCRELEFSSVNFDLIYGLPKQTKESFYKTVEKVLTLKPDRIALYSFAYVPWLKKHQNKIDAQALPGNEEKLEIFLNSRRQFLDANYQAIAMDHFALKNDELSTAFNKGTLYRNFMGYTVKPADEYIGLGLTSIGFLEHTFIQNFKTLKEYYEHLNQGHLPVERGKILSEDDRIRQWTIWSLMCQFKLDKDEFYRKFEKNFDEYFKDEGDHIAYCQADHLLNVQKWGLEVTELGKIFIRNICMGFDWYLRQADGHKKFSKTI